ncbi:MAG: fatty acid hydroxylase [Gammaproteobacteria bacterium]|nr:MAG: fatty acid hydroxylase [Gammaproteobacteria bacterium]
MTELNEFLILNEIRIRLVFFFGVFLLLAIWEVFSPRRKLILPKAMRWANNIALVFLNSLILRVLFPMAAVGMAVFAEEHGWGIFNYYDVSFAITVITSIVIMDAIIYLQHVMVHAIPVLWRIHRVHHADPDFDVTTGSRFHPLEIILSILIKFSVIVVLGPPVMAVIIFEVLLNASAMFNHSNIRINVNIDKYLRWIVVTPDMHRVHHSVVADETNSNFGFTLPWWDRLFGTYKDQPRAGHANMTIGINDYNQPKQVTWLSGMLTLPLIGIVSDYVINRRYKDE